MLNINEKIFLRTYKSKFISITLLTVILTVTASFAFLKNESVSTLRFISQPIEDSKILDITMHANTNLDDSLLNLYMSHTGRAMFYNNKGSDNKIDGLYFYKNFLDVFSELIDNEKNITIKKKKEVDTSHKFTITLPQYSNGEMVKLEDLISKIFDETEVIIKKRILFEINLEREEKLNNLAIMNNIISKEYANKLEIILKQRNNLLSERVNNKNLKQLVNIRDHRFKRFTKTEDLMLNENSDLKYGKIILFFLIFHFMFFFITLFLNPKAKKTSLKVRK